jgi:hypothetical protein
MFLAALRKAEAPLQQIRPALDLVRTKIGVEHALASKQLYVAGAQLLWEVIDKGGDTEAREGSKDLIVLKNGQYVFRQVIDQYLKQITYDDAYALRIELPGYEVAQIHADPAVNFGKPYFTHTGTPLAVMSLDPTGTGRKRWMTRWKAALNAFEITFEGRLAAARN